MSLLSALSFCSHRGILSLWLRGSRGEGGVSLSAQTAESRSGSEEA